MVRTVRQCSFNWRESLRVVLMKEGLETLGTSEHNSSVFSNSEIQKARLPSTLRRIEHNAFWDYRRLRSIALPEGPQYIGSQCFCASGLESVRFPSTLKTIE